MNRSPARPRLSVTTGAKGVVSHIGARLLADLADAVGLSDALSEAMAPTKKRRRGWDRGRVLVDLAVALADGATTITDLAILRNQPGLFGEVASLATAWRTLEAVDDAARARIQAARAEARRAAWEAGADPGHYVIDIDATLVEAHSEKEKATPTYKHGFGHYPLMAYLDATGEALVGRLRPGNAGSGTAADMVAVLDAALAQLPVIPTTMRSSCAPTPRGCPMSSSTPPGPGRSASAWATASWLIWPPWSAICPRTLGFRASPPTGRPSGNTPMPPRSPTTWTSRPGRRGPGPSPAVSWPIPGPSCPSPT